MSRKVLFIIVLQLALFTKSWATQCVAHRGNNKYALENSMESLRSAYQVGADIIEFDIHHTADGEAILMHDKTLKRTAMDRPGRACPLKEKIDKLTTSEIMDNCILQNGEDIPLLSQVFDEFSSLPVRFFLEMKDMPSQQTLELIEQYYSFQPKKLTIISFKDEALTLVANDPITLPLVNNGVKLLHLGLFSFCTKKDFDGVGLRKPSKRVVRRLMGKELEVAAYTVDNVKRMEKYVNAGISYVISNDPASCLSLLDRGSVPVFCPPCF